MTFDADAVFQREFDKAIAADVKRSGFPLETWFRNGRTKPVDAVVTWRERGPELVRRFIQWFEGSGYQVWVTPDGRPAIELDLKPMFGEIQVHMYVDLVLQNEYGLCVVDLKSGYLKPGSLQQVAMYACGIELEFGIRPLFGTYYHARGSGPRGADPDDLVYFLTPRPLTAYQYSVEFFSKELAMMDRAVEAEIFLARVGEHCERCGVAGACLAVGGDRAAEFDPVAPGYGRDSRREASQAHPAHTSTQQVTRRGLQ